MAIVRHDKELPEGHAQKGAEHSRQHLPPEQLPEGVERFSWRNFWQAALAFFQLEYGLLQTLRDLVLQPQRLFQGYLFGPERRTYTNPITLVLLSSAAVVLVLIQFGGAERMNALHAQEGLAPIVDSLDRLKAEYHYQDSILTASGDSLALAAFKTANDAHAESIMQEQIMSIYVGLMASYYNVFMLFSIPMISLVSWLLYRKSGLHYAEHLVVNGYILSMQNLIFLPLAPKFSADMQGWASITYMVLSLGYQVYAYARYFRDRLGMRIFRAFATSLLGMVAYSIVLGSVFIALAFLMVMRYLNA